METIIIILIVVAILFYRKKRKKEKEDFENTYLNSSYVTKIWDFIEFFHAFPGPAAIIITPSAIRARVFDQNLAEYFSLFESLHDGNAHAVGKWIDKDGALAQFQKLGLFATLYNDDIAENTPVISMYVFCCLSASEGEKYANAIKKKYMQKYGKELTIWFDENFMKGALT